MTITCETAKKLKAFLGESAPEPMDNMYYYDGLRDSINKGKKTGDTKGVYHSVGPAYQFHDLLSKSFCNAMACKQTKWHADGISKRLWRSCYEGGIPAVERCLCEMMLSK